MMLPKSLQPIATGLLLAPSPSCGTFSELPDAEKVRGQIAFTGNDAQIEYRREAGKRVYRVRLGPFDNETAAEEIRQTLADNGIQGTVMHQPN